MNKGIDYGTWKEERRDILEGFAGKRLFVMFSGGKDSSLALHFVSQGSGEFGFDFEVHAGAYPMARYTDPEKQALEAYWRKRGVSIQWHDMGETDDALERASNPCLVCQKVRKKALNAVLSGWDGEWERLVLVVSYSLWDIASYAVEYLLGDLFAPAEKGGCPEKSKRFEETAQRFYPLLRMEEGYTVFRPLVAYNTNDIVRTLEDEGIPVLSMPCRYGEFRPKRILEQYYQKMGLRFDYDRVLDFAKKALDLPSVSSYTAMERAAYLEEVF